MTDKEFYEDLLSKWKNHYQHWYYESMTSKDSFTVELSKSMMKICLQEIDRLKKYCE